MERLSPKKYVENGVLHREDGPAVVYDPDRPMIGDWYLHGVLHREDGPAVVYDPDRPTIGDWYLHGLLHREDGPAVHMAQDGATVWYRKGKIHRVGGPARYYADGHVEEWFEDGLRHCPDGAAIRYANGSYEWWRHGRRVEKVRAMQRTGNVVAICHYAQTLCFNEKEKTYSSFDAGPFTAAEATSFWGKRFMDDFSPTTAWLFVRAIRANEKRCKA